MEGGFLTKCTLHWKSLTNIAEIRKKLHFKFYKWNRCMHVEVELEYQESNHFSPFHIRLFSKKYGRWSDLCNTNKWFKNLTIWLSRIKKASFKIMFPWSHALSDVIFNSTLFGKAWDNTRDGNILFCFGPHKKCTMGHKNIRTDCLIIVKVCFFITHRWQLNPTLKICSRFFVHLEI